MVTPPPINFHLPLLRGVIDIEKIKRDFYTQGFSSSLRQRKRISLSQKISTVTIPFVKFLPFSKRLDPTIPVLALK